MYSENIYRQMLQYMSHVENVTCKCHMSKKHPKLLSIQGFLQVGIADQSLLQTNSSIQGLLQDKVTDTRSPARQKHRYRVLCRPKLPIKDPLQTKIIDKGFLVGQNRRYRVPYEPKLPIQGQKLQNAAFFTFYTSKLTSHMYM